MHMLNTKNIIGLSLGLCVLSAEVQANNWSDTSVGVRWSTGFKEPYNPNKITKTILNATHVSKDNYGRNFLFLDYYISDTNDPSKDGVTGAEEFYGFYRRTLSYNALAESKISNSLIKDVHLTTRIDAGYENTALSPRPFKVRAGSLVDINIPKGHLEWGIEGIYQKSHNGITNKHFEFDPSVVTWINWNYPITPKTQFSGILEYMGAIGEDGFGNETKPLTIFRANLIHDIGQPKGFKVGVGYELFNNKYSSNNEKDPTGNSDQSTALLLASYHF